MQRWFLCACVVAVVIPLCAVSQNPSTVIRVDVPVVTFEAVVLDSAGRTITTLQRNAFALYEDGQPRKIQNFSSAEVPYSALLLFQNSRPAPKDLNKVVPIYEQIGKELGTSYSFGFASDATPGTTHRIELRVSDQSLRVIQSRESYAVR